MKTGGSGVCGAPSPGLDPGGAAFSRADGASLGEFSRSAGWFIFRKKRSFFDVRTGEARSSWEAPTSAHLDSFHPEMVFLANLGVNLPVCLCGDLQVASAQTFDFL
ncbi:hypothetical protein TRIP_B330134 [uncultured Desulfatiglans sp.]|uniref:Uncharacterized protein n=1 Tax=Uncultured Desulfatiglans sp. TaxID=1748965 RepID=A0A653A7G9_UNCDX|nr:hypothetical protein TRIP_B330134 [uncultured Desulfatiglans sp.]